MILGVDEFFQLRRAADAADEVDALAGARVVDAEDGLQQPVLKNADVELVDGAGVLRRLPEQLVPLVLQIHAALAGLGGRFDGGGLHGEDLADLLDELLAVEAVQILHRTIVGQDFEFIAREEHAEEPVVVLAAVVVRIGLAAHLADAEGAGRAVVTIGDVGAGHLAFKQSGEGDAETEGQTPDLMPHAVGSIDFVDRAFILHEAFNEGADARTLAIGEEDGAGIGAEGVHEARAIVLLVRPGLFVLFDDVLLVVLGVADGDESGLAVAGDGLPVEIHRGLRLTREDAVLLHALKALLGLRIDRVGIRIDFRVEVDLRPIDMQQAVGLAFGEFGRLITIHDVVGDGGDFGGEFRGRDETFE